MNTILETIKEYLSLQKTNYAIQINGPWGTGKTHYVTQVLKEEIEKIEVNKKDKYKFIYISLNGLRNVDEIGESVFLASISKSGSYAYMIGRTSLEFGSKLPIPGFKALETVDKKISNITKLRNHLKKCVLCFDDLERIDKSVTIQQVLGYINSTYIEHEHIKTLFISNEDKLHDNVNFRQIKEKVIGRTIQYDKKLSEILPDFMKNNYEENDNIKEFYKKNRDIILQIINFVNEKINLRTLRFVFDSLSQVMNKCDLLKEQNEAICLSVFTNILLISIDYKEGILKDKEELEYLYEPHMLGYLLSIEEKKGVEPDYKSLFWNKYFKEKTIISEFIHLYKSVCDYILTGHLNVELFENEIKSRYIQEEDPKEKALKIVENYMEFELNQLEESVEFVCRSLENGEYHPHKYPNLYHLLFEFSKKKFTEIDLGKLYMTCDSGLEKALELYEFEEDEIRFDRQFGNVINNENYTKLVSKIEAKRIEKLKEKEADVLGGFFKSIKEADIERFREYYTKIRHENNFFTVINQEELCKELLSYPNKGLGFFMSFLREKYLRVSNARDFYSHEIDPINNFINAIKENLEEIPVDALKRDIILKLIKVLEEIIKHISKELTE
ncbi:TPA: hypothetical protein ROY06_004685 [Bacillus cereus]|uniref:P-loop NTPase fold protein n=2 Tax=Bacillus thuringiensis TaxID=1428 RepID=UPI000BFE06BE|nr:P-loop NTPase fold protein [Bacillus thuringiensis]PGY05574.1 hypothetical protein COE41_02930 [Bacillus thuringiensis]HDX9511357.1 hypothetical protein [Bacillus cereus]